MLFGNILPGLSNLTGGGALTAPTSSNSAADSVVGPVNIGGLNAPALPSQTNTLVLVGGAVLVAFLLARRRR